MFYKTLQSIYYSQQICSQRRRGGGGGHSHHSHVSHSRPRAHYHSHAYHGVRHHHHYGYSSGGDDCSLCFCFIALLGLCIPDKKKVPGAIACQITRIVLLLTGIILIILYYSLTQAFTVTNSLLLDNQFPYQLYVDPQELGYSKFKILNDNYTFYKCDYQYDIEDSWSGNVTVTGDFKYINYDNQFGYLYDSQDKFKMTVDGRSRALSESNNTQTISFSSNISIYDTNNGINQFQFRKQNVHKCTQINGKTSFSSYDEVFGEPKQQTQGLSAQSLQIEAYTYKLDSGIMVGGIIILVVYVFVGLICLTFFQNCVLCCGLFCCKSQAFQQLKNGNQQTTVVQQEVVYQQAQQPTTVVIQQPQQQQQVYQQPQAYQQPQPQVATTQYQQQQTILPPMYQDTQQMPVVF